MSVNAAVAEQLQRIAQLCELLGEDKFRVIAHQRAARVVEGLSGDLAQIAASKADLLKIDGDRPEDRRQDHRGGQHREDEGA